MKNGARLKNEVNNWEKGANTESRWRLMDHGARIKWKIEPDPIM